MSHAHQRSLHSLRVRNLHGLSYWIDQDVDRWYDGSFQTFFLFHLMLQEHNCSEWSHLWLHSCHMGSRVIPAMTPQTIYHHQNLREIVNIPFLGENKQSDRSNIPSQCHQIRFQHDYLKWVDFFLNKCADILHFDSYFLLFDRRSQFYEDRGG